MISIEFKRILDDRRSTDEVKEDNVSVEEDVGYGERSSLIDFVLSAGIHSEGVAIGGNGKENEDIEFIRVSGGGSDSGGVEGELELKMMGRILNEFCNI